jgi:DNA-binding NarL/FixJ family response regulator
VATGWGIVIIDADAIYRAGMLVCLKTLPEVERIADCASAEEALGEPALVGTELGIVSLDSEEAAELIHRLHLTIGCRVLATATRLQEGRVRSAVEAGAVGVVSKANLTTDGLVAQVRAALHGAGIVPADLLSSLVGASEPRRPPRGLSTRERGVLRLLADGKLIREVAHELCYSERTVKSVIRDATAKLGASSRSQAIALAVREGLI